MLWYDSILLDTHLPSIEIDHDDGDLADLRADLRIFIWQVSSGLHDWVGSWRDLRGKSD